MVEDTIFEGMEGQETALVLNKVMDASITTSIFISSPHGSTTERHDISPYARDQDFFSL